MFEVKQIDYIEYGSVDEFAKQYNLRWFDIMQFEDWQDKAYVEFDCSLDRIGMLKGELEDLMNNFDYSANDHYYMQILHCEKALIETLRKMGYVNHLVVHCDVN